MQGRSLARRCPRAYALTNLLPRLKRLIHENERVRTKFAAFEAALQDVVDNQKALWRAAQTHIRGDSPRCNDTCAGIACIQSADSNTRVTILTARSSEWQRFGQLPDMPR